MTNGSGPHKSRAGKRTKATQAKDKKPAAGSKAATLTKRVRRQPGG